MVHPCILSHIILLLAMIRVRAFGPLRWYNSDMKTFLTKAAITVSFVGFLLLYSYHIAGGDLQQVRPIKRWVTDNRVMPDTKTAGSSAAIQ